MNRAVHWMMLSCFAACLVPWLGSLAPSHARADDEAAFAALSVEYDQGIRPLMKQFCLDCHSTAAKEGELDLERFASLADVRRVDSRCSRHGDIATGGHGQSACCRGDGEG